MGSVGRQLGKGARPSSGATAVRARSSVRVRRGEAARLEALIGYGVLDSAPEDGFDRITALAADLFDAPIALVSFVDAERQWVKSGVGIEATETPRELAFCNHLIAAGPGVVMVVEDASGDPRFSQMPLVAGEAGIRFYAGAALTTPQGHNLGTLCVLDRVPRPTPSPRMLERLRTLAKIASNELELRQAGHMLVSARQSAEEFARRANAAEAVAGLGHWRLNLANNELIWSPQLYRIYGLPADADLDLELVKAVLHPEDAETRLARLQRQIDTGEPDEGSVHRIVRPDGEVRYLERRSVAERGPDGAVSAIVGTVMDITERKRIEAVIAESEERYRRLADAAPDMITECALDGTIIYVSPACKAITGVEPAMLVGLNSFDLMNPEDAVRARFNCQRMLDSGGKVAPSPTQFRVTCPDGREIWLESKPAPTFDPATGEMIGFIDVTRDMTARKAMEAELESAREAAEVAAAAKGDFLANMTHELRTPLNAIIGFSGVLKADPQLSARHARQVDLIWDASQTLLGVINDILDFSKLEAGGVEFDAHPFDPRQLAETSVSMLSGLALTKGLAMSVSADGLEGLLLGDEARLRQVLLNFVSNAIKFTLRGNVQVLVSQTADGDQRRLRVEVKDSGIGVQPDQINAIFARFAQADASVTRQYGGTGLGLAISKRIIEALGGQVGVDSVVGQGSTFWFEVSMPVAEIMRVDEASVQQPAAVDQALRLLVVDDNAVNRELVCALLAPFDLVIETATDGIEAVEAVSRSSFDLILMDVQMPNMDGLTAARHIRAAGPAGARRIPIIAMTANVLPEQVARCLEAGMDDHLGKPINPQKLLETLDRWSPSEPSAEASPPEQEPPHGHQSGV